MQRYEVVMGLYHSESHNSNNRLVGSNPAPASFSNLVMLSSFAFEPVSVGRKPYNCRSIPRPTEESLCAMPSSLLHFLP